MQLNVKLRIKIHIISLGMLLFGGVFSKIHAQHVSYAIENVNHPLIHSVLLHPQGWGLSMPVINLEEEESLEFHFDYLDKPELDFSYAIDYCNYDWEISDLSEHDYLEGFNEVPLYDYEPSRNTLQFYTHYSAQLPNEDLKITRSGNYRLRVYDSGDPDSLLITRRFAILDPKVEIKGRVNMPDYEQQELELRINLKSLPVTDPLQEIKVVVIKNYDWNNRVAIQAEPVLRNQILHFDKAFQIITGGGNEFRQIDTKDTRFVSNGVEQIIYRAPYYNYVLEQEKLKQYNPYFSEKDLNGRSYYEIPDAVNRHLDADYVHVAFRLECDPPLDSDVYIYGALTDWKTDSANKMYYQPELGRYEKELFIKQGLLNYSYAQLNPETQELDFSITEGNHSETENDYLVFVYYRGVSSDWDELVGFEVINSRGEK